MANSFLSGQRIGDGLSGIGSGAAGSRAGGVSAVAMIGSKLTELGSDIAGIHSALADGDIEIARGRIQSSNALLRQKEAEINARLASFDAKRTLRFGRKRALQRKVSTTFLQSSQRARAAAQGVEASSGSVAQSVDDFGFISELDAATTELNAQRAAFGFEQRSLAFSRQASAAGFFARESELAAEAREAQADFLSGVKIASAISGVGFTVAGALSGVG